VVAKGSVLFVVCLITIRRLRKDLTRLYALSEGLKKLATARWVSAGLSFYAWKINRDWQKRNQVYLRALANASRTAGVDGTDNGRGAAGEVGWTDATRRPTLGIHGLTV